MAGEQRTWGGRFEGDMDSLTRDYTAGSDRDLYEHDIAGSIAHARMLGRRGIIPAADADAIVRGLDEVLQEFRAGRVVWRPELEDIHTHVEALLRERIGEAAGRLHTARSRNDQVALLNRLLVRERCDRLIKASEGLTSALCDLAEEHAADPMPGYTHVQRAQPVTLGHHLLAYGEMFLRDRDRFRDCRGRTNVLPLGSGALAGSPYPLDRHMVAKELGFDAISRNSLDATSDRDFIAEFLAACAITQMHLSRFAEEIVLWASAEFGFVRLPDAFATGSSMMPQKKNADVAELARGRTGRVYGELISMLVNLKGLPLAYNRDLQEDKTAVLNAAAVVEPSLVIFAAMVPALEFELPRMREAAGQSFSLATDVADYLVKKGMPFREAHSVVGQLVKECEARGCELNQLPLAVYRAASGLFEPDILALDVDAALAARDLPGGTAPRQVLLAAKQLRAAL
ncbi:MAG: argininosuccinate lyase [Dehalococcoidia bacterium]|nr:argininosuccinate lyase [Chloroflexi bacterium CFX7]MCK6565006.1 argininosuccinate lyase [Dehalococcoidia bacterium]MCL4230004.1 argininosuccinate lyase [Dehalococcoidia bacterium]NUQ54430.1 argininosuccinate lyase [Dehalococcoidia bacterium]RIL02260.1 MAG: argininosuccinate lyase [bacterium]